MRRAVWRAGGAACLCVLAACATSPPPRIAYHPAPRAGARRIVIVDAGPTRLHFASGASQSFAKGIVDNPLGGILLAPVLLVALAADKVFEAELDARVQSVSFDYGEALAQALAARLAASGYNVERVSFVRRASSDGRGWIDDYRRWIGAGDAVLDVAAPMAGYTTFSTQGGYRPAAIACVRMVLPPQRRIVLRECYSHDLPVLRHDAVQVAGDGLPGFASWGALIAVPTEAADGLRRSALAIADQIAIGLRP